ncbi:Nucleic acid dioxygenase alkbh1 [Bulinus truncatus]|nr:Nucleic acid dioxygenase alkbh1 [Bulinus truncatus]
MESDVNVDLFTPEFKYYKSKNPPPDLSKVVDITTLNNSEKISCLSLHHHDLQPLIGMKPYQEWKVYQFPKYPGFIFIQNPFLDRYQYYWISKCLRDFPSDKDNETNLSALGAEKGCKLWSDFLAKKCKSLNKDEPLRQLRWTTLGYHYNWTTKEYSEESKAEFPQDVNCLTQYLAASLGFFQYKAEAAIINYYHSDSTLAGHTDHSEIDHSAPLFSISFGQSAIFLLGGKTKLLKPMAVFVRSGDICIMGGESRLAYHAVPKILASSFSLPCYDTAKKASSDSLPHQTACTSCSVLCCNQTHYHNQEKCHLYEHGNAEGQNSSGNNINCQAKIIGINPDQKNFRIESESNQILHSDGLQHSYDMYNQQIKGVNANIESVMSTLDINQFNIYLNSSRINLNVRQVLPPDKSSLHFE